MRYHIILGKLENLSHAVGSSRINKNVDMLQYYVIAIDVIEKSSSINTN